MLKKPNHIKSKPKNHKSVHWCTKWQISHYCLATLFCFLLQIKSKNTSKNFVSFLGYSSFSSNFFKHIEKYKDSFVQSERMFFIVFTVCTRFALHKSIATFLKNEQKWQYWFSTTEWYLFELSKYTNIPKPKFILTVIHRISQLNF